MQRVLKIAVATAAFGFAATATPASAALVLNSNGTVTLNNAAGPTSATINFDGEVNGNVIAGLASTLMLTLTGVSGNAYSFTYDLSTSSAANLVGFGFDTSPTLTSVTGITGPLAIVENANFPGVGTVDACFYSGNNCGAANNQAKDFSGGFTLNFGSSPVTLSNFVDRYASIVAADGQSGEGFEVKSPLPEPTTWGMMLLGFAGIGIALRRKPNLMQIA